MKPVKRHCAEIRILASWAMAWRGEQEQGDDCSQRPKFRLKGPSMSRVGREVGEIGWLCRRRYNRRTRASHHRIAEAMEHRLKLEKPAPTAISRSLALIRTRCYEEPLEPVRCDASLVKRKLNVGNGMRQTMGFRECARSVDMGRLINMSTRH